MTNDELRLWRHNKGFTQEKAAKFLSKSVQQYRKYEYGKAPIPYLVVKFIKLSSNIE
jgi:transcriptional regulator with XRE-family HTH domain